MPQMLQKFGDIDDGEADAPAPRMARVVKATKKSPEDLAALQTWADTAPIGAEKEFQVPLGSACTCSSWEVMILMSLVISKIRSTFSRERLSAGFFQ